MTMTFACESCGASGQVDESMAGRTVRCRHCKHVFTIPRPGEVVPNAYDLAEPIVEPATTAPDPASDAASAAVPSPPAGYGGSTFSPTYREPRSQPPRKERARPKRRDDVDPRELTSDWRVRMIVGVVAVGGVLAVASLVVPGAGMIGGAILTGTGLLLVVFGWSVGAYAAFCEDFLLTTQIYTGYYLVTRWDDLWPWFTCSTIGVGLTFIGSRVLELSGAV